MRPDREQLIAAIAGADPTGRNPGDVADAILAKWPAPEPMTGDQAAHYADQLLAELGRALGFLRDELDPAGDLWRDQRRRLADAGDPRVAAYHPHTSPSCWCSVPGHTIAGRRETNRAEGIHETGAGVICWCAGVHDTAQATQLSRTRHP